MEQLGEVVGDRGDRRVQLLKFLLVQLTEAYKDEEARLSSGSRGASA